MKFGRFQVVEPEENLALVHHPVQRLQTVDFEPKNAVLDQANLFAQGIDTAALVPGAAKVDELGSCTANAAMSALSNILVEPAYLVFTKASSYSDTKGIEGAAIRFYHGCTDQTATAAQEWPPTDVGSSGPYIARYALSLGVAKGQQIASGAQSIVSLLQSGGLLVGQPFLKAWMTPDSVGFIDGNGSAATLEAQIAQGVAGGHETYLCAIEGLLLSETGAVIPEKTILRFRNSWGPSWGLDGDYLAHLSTYVTLGSYCDFRALT